MAGRFEQYEPDLNDIRKCKECGNAKAFKEFGKLVGNRRRHICNRCHRGLIEARRHGMELEEYLSYSSGPCNFCSNTKTRAFKLTEDGPPVARVCFDHQIMLRMASRLKELKNVDQIVRVYPFISKFLTENDLSLFSVEPENKSD